MSRAADYTIQGFIYQFNKTLFEILNDEEDSSVTIEGIIEDIEIQTPTHMKAIQCKYHEGQGSFTLSTIYKPILQMMKHFHNKGEVEVEYRLYAYFPSEQANSTRTLTKVEIEEIFSSENQKLQSMIAALRGFVHVEDFLQHFTLEFGLPLSELIKTVQQLMCTSGFEVEEIETLVYPNAIQMIADMSIKHNPQDRLIRKSELVTRISDIRKTAITRWVRALSTFDKAISTRKKQLKPNLNINSRLRYLLIDQSNLEGFDDCIVTFIGEYLSKYHFKEIHDRTPLICINCSTETFNDIRVRLYKKQINVNDGYVTDTFFDKAKFVREPRRWKDGKTLHTDFSLRLIRFSPEALGLLNEHKGDDVFVFHKEIPEGLDTLDINVEHIDLTKVQEIKFVLGMSDTYE